MAGGKVTSPTGTAPDRYVYYPGTEELGADEIRVIACGKVAIGSAELGASDALDAAAQAAREDE